MIDIQLRIKTRAEKLLGVFLNMCQSKCIFPLNTVEKWKWKWMANGDIQDLQQEGLNQQVLNRFEEYVEDLLSKKWKQN